MSGVRISQNFGPRSIFFLASTLFWKAKVLGLIDEQLTQKQLGPKVRAPGRKNRSNTLCTLIRVVGEKR